MRFDSAVGRSSGVVPGQDFVGPVDDGVEDVCELGQLASFVEVTEPVERIERAVVVVG